MTHSSEVAPEVLLGNLPARIAHTTLAGEIIYVNRLVPPYTMEGVRGRSIFDFTEPAYRDVARGTLARVIETGEPASYANISAGAHGKPTHYFTIIAPVVEGGEVRSVIFMATDVSPVTEAHRALHESETKLRVALQASGVGIWTFSHGAGGCLDAATAALFGFPPDAPDPGYAGIMERIHPDDRERVAATVERAFETGTYGPIEHRVVRPDGSVRWASARGRADVGAGQLVGSVVDITERREQEEQLAQAARMDSIGRLAGGIAHDFNNMLTAIMSYAELGLAGVAPGSPVAADLAEIRRAAERSRSLTSGLLAFARQQRTEPRVSDPDVLVQQVERLLQRILGEDIELTSSLAATRNVRVDPSQFEHVLINLATNARDAMPAGGRLSIETLDVELGEREAEAAKLSPGPYVRIRVTDTGHGIPAEILGHVFEPFFTTKAAGKGTGLGLAQCYGIARQAGGQVRIASEVGVGTEVTIDLPAVAEVPEPEPVEAPTAQLASRCTILLVEDEPLVRKLATRVLVARGYAVLEAAGGAEALALAEQHAGTIDALVTDMVMPGMTGVTLAETLRRARPGIAVVVMSGYSEELVTSGGTDEAFVFLAKPFIGAELLATIELALRPR